MSGYVKQHRSCFDHPIVGFHVPAPRPTNGKRPVPPFMAWQWLISNAAWRDHEMNNKGRRQKLSRGQLLAGRNHLADAWQWSEQNVRTFLKNLQAHAMVEINQSDGHYTAVVTICNYSIYQSESAADNQQPNQSLTRESPETNHTEGKEELKEEEIKNDTRVNAKSDDPFGLRPSCDVTRCSQTGKLTLVNGLKSVWLERFDGDENRLTLALEVAAAYVQTNSTRPLEAQVSSQLARVVAEKVDRDKRYSAAANKDKPRMPAKITGRNISKDGRLIGCA